MSYRVGVQSRTFRVFPLARRILTDRLTPLPPPRLYNSISDKASVRPPPPTARLAFVRGNQNPTGIKRVAGLWDRQAANAPRREIVIRKTGPAHASDYIYVALQFTF